MVWVSELTDVAIVHCSDSAPLNTFSCRRAMMMLVPSADDEGTNVDRRTA